MNVIFILGSKPVINKQKVRLKSKFNAKSFTLILILKLIYVFPIVKWE